MKNLQILIYTILVFVVFSSCGKNALERNLDGEWFEVTPCYTSNCDTLRISKDGDFKSNSHRSSTYVKIDAAALEVTKSDGFVKTYRIELDKDATTLTIYCFGPNLVGRCDNITFIKNE